VAVTKSGNLLSYLISPAILDELLEIRADALSLQRIKKMDLSQAVDVIRTLCL